MRDLISTPAKEYRQFEAALALIVVLPPPEVAGLLIQRRQALHGQADRIRETLRAGQEADTDPVFLIENEYQLALVEAELGFSNGSVNASRAMIPHSAGSGPDSTSRRIPAILADRTTPPDHRRSSPERGHCRRRPNTIPANSVRTARPFDN